MQTLKQYFFFSEFLSLSILSRFIVVLFSFGNPFATLAGYIIGHNIAKFLFESSWISLFGYLVTFIIWAGISFLLYLLFLKILFNNFKTKTKTDNIAVFLKRIRQSQYIYIVFLIMWISLWVQSFYGFILVAKDPSIGGAMDLSAFETVWAVMSMIFFTPLFVGLSSLIYYFSLKNLARKLPEAV